MVPDPLPLFAVLRAGRSRDVVFFRVRERWPDDRAGERARFTTRSLAANKTVDGMSGEARDGDSFPRTLRVLLDACAAAEGDEDEDDDELARDAWAVFSSRFHASIFCRRRRIRIRPAGKERASRGRGMTFFRARSNYILFFCEGTCVSFFSPKHVTQ